MVQSSQWISLGLSLSKAIMIIARITFFGRMCHQIRMLLILQTIQKWMLHSLTSRGHLSTVQAQSSMLLSSRMGNHYPQK